jgi:hypothetical protein
MVEAAELLVIVSIDDSVSVELWRVKLLGVSVNI